jgi:hypothetical protein
MHEKCTYGSVGAPGGQPPGATWLSPILRSFRSSVFVRVSGEWYAMRLRRLEDEDRQYAARLEFTLTHAADLEEKWVEHGKCVPFSRPPHNRGTQQRGRYSTAQLLGGRVHVDVRPKCELTPLPFTLTSGVMASCFARS